MPLLELVEENSRRIDFEELYGLAIDWLNALVLKIAIHGREKSRYTVQSYFWDEVVARHRLERAPVVVSPRRRIELGLDGVILHVGPIAWSVTRRAVLTGPEIAVLPGEFMLLLSDEYVVIPPGYIAQVHILQERVAEGLSPLLYTYMPGFVGRIAIPLWNTSCGPVLMRRGEPIAQLVFFSAEDSSCITICARVCEWEGKIRIYPEDKLEMLLTTNIAVPGEVNTARESVLEYISPAIQKLMREYLRLEGVHTEYSRVRSFYTALMHCLLNGYIEVDLEKARKLYLTKYWRQAV